MCCEALLMSFLWHCKRKIKRERWSGGVSGKRALKSTHRWKSYVWHSSTVANMENMNQIDLFSICLSALYKKFSVYEWWKGICGLIIKKYIQTALFRWECYANNKFYATNLAWKFMTCLCCLFRSFHNNTRQTATVKRKDEGKNVVKGNINKWMFFSLSSRQTKRNELEMILVDLLEKIGRFSNN